MLDKNNDERRFGEEAIDLFGLFEILKRHCLMILTITLFFVASSVILSCFFLAPVYEVKTTLMVTSQVLNSRDAQQTTINTYAGQVKSDVLMQRVIDRLNLNHQNNYEGKVYTPKDLSKQVQAAPVTDSNLINIIVSNSDPKLAALLANTLSKEFITFMAEKNQEVIDTTVTSIQNQLVVLQKELDSTTDSARQTVIKDTMALLADRERIALSVNMDAANIVVASPAIPPVTPVKPNHALNMALSLVLGLMVSFASVFVKEFFDNTLKTADDVEKYFDLPVLGMIPHGDRHSRY